MKRNPYKILMSSLMIVSSTIVARAQSYSYSNAVAALNPVAYWPLDETNQGPAAYIATNSGTLGAQANGYYGNHFYLSGGVYTLMTLFTGPVAGPTSDGSQAAQFNGGANNNDNDGYVIIPDANHVLDKGPVPFSAECWVMPEGGDPNDVTGTNFASSEFAGIMKKGGGISFYTENGDTHNNTYGWTVSLVGIYGMGPPGGWYGGFSPGEFLMTNAAWVVDLYNGANGNVPSLEFDVPMAEPTPQWFHLMLTYDGTNANFYTNGVLAATTVLGLPQSTNHVIAPNQLGFVSATGAYQFKLNSSGAGYVPDTLNPFCVGNNNESASDQNGGWPQTNNFTGFNCQNFNGALADVAVYTNALSEATVLKHYQDATGSPTLYTNDVLSANPPLFLRFNEPAYTEPDPTSFAVANSYGSMSGANGAYQPGVIPGVPGAVANGLGPISRAAQMNGFDAGVDVGGGVLFGSDLDPQNGNNGGLLPSFSVAFVFKGNPADCYGRFETILGRGDAAWRFDMDQSGTIHWNPGANPEINTPNNFNDGLWHHVVGVCDGSTGNTYLYMDGQLSTSGTGAGALNGSSDDLLIGGAPDYTADNNNNQRYFPGGVAELAFFTNALTAAQVQTLYGAAGLAPVILQEPAASTVIGLGAFGLLAVTASGSSPTYQWYQGTAALTDVAGNISGSATATLTITNATLSNAGNYTVVVANSAGSVTSSVATVTVSEAPTVLQQPSPANVRLYQGNPASYTVGVVGAAPFTFQWYNGTSAINGAMSSNVTVIAAPGTNTYDCVIQNTYGAATSSVLTVVGQLPPPSLVVNYSVVSPAYNGQGAFSDPGNNTWNLFAANGTPSYDARNSAGASTLVTATLTYGFNNGSQSGVTNGTPSYLLCTEDAVNAGAPGIGTSDAPEGQLTINDLPQGSKYQLYLYSANYDDNRGSIFSLVPANPGIADLGSNGCVNGCITGAIEHGGTNRFAEGDNYVLFDDVVPDTNGVITVTYIANPAGVLTGEAPFDGFQIVKIVPPVMSVNIQGGSNDVVSWAPAIGILLSSPNVGGPYSTNSGATSPYTNSISGTPQQFFRVEVP